MGRDPLHLIDRFNNPCKLIVKSLDQMRELFDAQNLIRVSRKKIKSISEIFFSIDPSAPS